MLHSSIQLKRLRQYFNITQDEFAEKIGVKRNSISMIESGRNKPTFEMIGDICKAFNISADYFLLDEEPNAGATYFVTNAVENVIDINNHLNEADFLNQAQVRSKQVNFLYQSLIDIRLLLFQELNIKGDFATKAEADLLNTLARPSIIDNEFRYPYNNLDTKGKIEYLRKIDSCITLFTNTFFECFDQLYTGTLIPQTKEMRDEFLKRRAQITDNWRYTHVYKNVKK
ncbi:helix-turn-helix transcriptional regulator [Mucilaginibacter sp.]|uniref:helix-turn-helix domain-containing protein n=1 Tax=Mucilaginibacter sp. TaxID=1882438 RepID=UPI00260CF34E|nr:helix-turn-helix transcriptional regulator [Mucilaginibacter sp.]MDB5029712.1 DNA-binding helix-turn-helix protein [Mucilaginibacter sp.]